MKQIKFTKTQSKMDDVEFIHTGQVVATFENPKQRILPHDFLHALAESIVESLQGMLWSGGMDHTKFNEWIASICQQRSVPSIAFTGEQFRRLKLAIEAATKEWNELAAGESI